MSWAQSVRGRLSRLKRAAPNCFGGDAHAFELRPPIDAQKLAALLQSLAAPADYVEFLAEAGTHGAGPGYGLLPPVNCCGWEHPFPAGHDWAPDMANPAEVGVVEGLGGDYYSDFWTHGCIALADWGCGVVSLLLVNAPAPVQGRVFIDVRWAGEGIRQTHASFREFYESWLELVERGDSGVNVNIPRGTCANWNALDNYLGAARQRLGAQLTEDSVLRTLRDIPDGGIAQLTDEDSAYYRSGDSLRPCPACSERIRDYVARGFMRPGQLAPGDDLRALREWR
ncbi:MAG: hypothetical protein H6718_13835 [Polyangiaceae bacterium]|nr:hypothetical protein [Polyangiaceae bacterium]MCB9605985.1 hypothetical protein [Polyangiaceae bacterium]